MSRISKLTSPIQKKSKITTKFVYYVQNQVSNPRIEITSLLVPSKSYEKYTIQNQEIQIQQTCNHSDTTSGVLSKSYTDEYYENSILSESFQDTCALNSDSVCTIDEDPSCSSSSVSNINNTINTCSSLTNVTPLTPIDGHLRRMMKRSSKDEFKKNYTEYKDEQTSRETISKTTKKTSPRRFSSGSFRNRGLNRKANDYVNVKYASQNESSPKTEPPFKNFLNEAKSILTNPKTIGDIRTDSKVECFTSGKVHETLPNGIKKIIYKNGTVKYVYPDHVASPTCLSPPSVTSIASVMSPKTFSSQVESIFKNANDFLKSTIQFVNGDLVDLYQSGTEIYYLRQQDLVIEKHVDNKEVYRYLDTDTIEIKYPDGYVECFKSDDLQEFQLIYTN